VSITEGTQPVPVHPTGTTATTAAFTPEASSLLVALVAADGLSGGPATTATVSDSLSGSWTLLVRKNAFNGSAPFLGGTVEVWIRDIGSSPASMTVTASGWSANGGNLTVRTLIGALPVAQQPGATGSAGSTGIAPTVTLTPTQIGSRIYGAALDYTTNATLTANANTTSIDQFVDAGNGDTWATFKASADTVSLTSTAYGYTNGNAEYQLAAAEILAASTADAGGHIQSGFHPGRGPTTARFYQTPKSYDVISAATINGTADLAGAGTVTDVPVIQAAPATLTGAGTLSASGVIAGSATLTGAGTLAATVTQGAGSTPAGTGALSVAVTESATATLTGAGTLAATVTEGATASLAGAGTLTSPVVQRVIATLAGAGVLTATAGAGAIGTQAAPYTPILVSLDNSATGSGTITGSGAGSGLEDNTATSGTIDGSSAPSSLDDAGAVSVSGLLG
jgi:hypothetical protein